MKSGANETLRLVVLGASWPLETFLRRLLVGLAVEGVDVVIAGRGAPPRDLPASLGWRRLPRLGPTRALRLVGVVAAALGALRRSPRDALRLLRRDAERSSLGALGRLLPHVGRADAVRYFPWNAGAVQHAALLDLGDAATLISCRGSQIHIAPHDPRRPGYAVALRRSFEQADRVHCVSDDLARHAVALGLESAKARVIRPAIDVDVFTPPPEPSPAGPPWRLVTTGSLIWRKGLEDLLVAVARLVDAGHDVQLEILGDGPERQRVVYTVHDLGLVDRVTLRGRVAPEVVSTALRRAHVFVLASLSEGIANAVLEAMACGLPCVSTQVGGMDEVITHDVDGLLVPARDPQALAVAVGTLLDDRERARRLGAAARRRVERGHRLEEQVRAFRDLVVEITPPVDASADAC